MSADDPRAASDDVASELVAGLERGAALVDRGAFGLDLAQARGKLAAFALPDPNRFVLLLVEVAHLLPGCSALSFTISSRGTQACLDGACLDADELRGCFDLPLAAADQRAPGDAQRLRARLRLGLALLAALGIAGGPIEIRSTTKAGTLRLLLEPGGGASLDMAAETSPTPQLSLLVPARSWFRGQLRRQHELLREHAYTSTIPLWLNRTRIDRGFDIPDVVDGVEILGEAGGSIGRAGWSASQFDRQSGAIMFVVNGVIVETAVEPALMRGFIAIVDASELERDLSLSKLRRGAAYESLVARVVAAQSTLSLPVPTRGPPIDRPQDRTDIVLATGAGTLFGAGGLLLGLVVMLVNPWPVTVMGLLPLCVGLAASVHARKKLAQALRNRRARVRGRATVGVVQSVSTRLDEVPEQTIRVRVEPEGAPAYEVEIVVDSHHKPDPGDRVFLRVDPADPSVVVLDSP